MRLFVAVALAAFGILAQPAFGQEPIKIGVMFPYTGPISAQGRPGVTPSSKPSKKRTTRSRGARSSCCTKTAPDAPTPG